jgi:error-prone DNA polymerase
VALARMTDGGEVVEDYRSVGLSLRRHPVAFLREDLSRRGMIACGDLARTRDGLRVKVSGIVLVRQRPGSASGVLFITIEDETGVANLIVWPSVFERHQRLILSAVMLACHGRMQREGDVIHVIADGLEDLSGLLRSVGGRDADVPIRAGRGDEARHGVGVDTRMPGGGGPGISDLRRDGGIKVPTRDFR